MKGKGRVLRGRLRGRVATGAAIVALTVGMSVFSAVGSAQAATGSHWNVAYKGQTGVVVSVTATSKTNAWAISSVDSGSSPEFLHWNGKAWSVRKISNIDGFSPTTIKATAAKNVWAFGYNDDGAVPYALTYNGSKWTGMALPDAFNSAEAAVLSPTSVWGVTSQSCTVRGQARCTVLVHWNGSDWSSVTVPGEVVYVDSMGGHAFFLALIDTKSGSNGTHTGKPVIYEPTSKMKTFAGPNVRLTDQSTGLAVEKNGQRYLEGGLATGRHPLRFYHEVGSKWSAISVPKHVCPPGSEGDCPLVVNPGVTYDGAHGFWAGWSAHYTGKRWDNTDVLGSSFRTNSATGYGASFLAVAPIPGSSSIWGVGGIFRDDSSSDHALVAVYGALP